MGKWSGRGVSVIRTREIFFKIYFGTKLYEPAQSHIYITEMGKWSGRDAPTHVVLSTVQL